MTLRLLLASNLSTAAMAALLIACLPHIGLLLLWCLLLVPYALAMLWWVIQLDHIDERLLPRDYGEYFCNSLGVAEQPANPERVPLKQPGVEKPRAHQPPRNP